MIFPIKTPFKLTTGFDEERPIWIRKEIKKLELVVERSYDDTEINAAKRMISQLQQKLHPHASWDVASSTADKNMIIHAPENGMVQYHLIKRVKKLNHTLNWPSGRWYAFSNYFFDIWGGLIIFYGKSGLTYVFVHIDEPDVRGVYESKDENFDSKVTFENLKHCVEGDVLGVSGNSGLCFGPHLHFELHEKKEWIRHRDRIDPKTIYPEVWSKHKHEIYPTEI